MAIACYLSYSRVWLSIPLHHWYHLIYFTVTCTEDCSLCSKCLRYAPSNDWRRHRPREKEKQSEQDTCIAIHIVEWAILSLHPSRRASPHFARYSFPIPHRVEGWVWYELHIDYIELIMMKMMMNVNALSSKMHVIRGHTSVNFTLTNHLCNRLCLWFVSILLILAFWFWIVKYEPWIIQCFVR